jgi:ATP-dependent DNA helicase UvrD/PcrA
MATMAAFSAGQVTWHQVTLRLAVFLTATDRGKQPPALALGLIGQAALPATFQRRVEELRGTLSDATDPLGEGIDVASTAWSALGVTSGYRPWTRAAATFGALAARTRLLGDVAAALERVQVDVRALRNASMVELDAGDIGAVQVMNFTQTKGREADATLLVFEDNDFFGYEAEPFRDASRLLYVAMTRARRRVVVLLPPWPHPLVAPLGHSPCRFRPRPASAPSRSSTTSTSVDDGRSSPMTSAQSNTAYCQIADACGRVACRATV